jgi:hypothetical protein
MMALLARSSSPADSLTAVPLNVPRTGAAVSQPGRRTGTTRRWWLVWAVKVLNRGPRPTVWATAAVGPGEIVALRMLGCNGCWATGAAARLS